MTPTPERGPARRRRSPDDMDDFLEDFLLRPWAPRRLRRPGRFSSLLDRAIGAVPSRRARP